ncbi:DUF2505 domain-containing protein [Antrihabitans sp. YC3-6]|uniref:DUF2505 domain-containing protein n=1 Tax=Antrihabitans stalagmiti TaxID=2799499 RepID=A0A934NP83_9NOCA|nr:DUF2505 domain-containing protein [Antrihabitans stalagmiti]MBJ8338893.1 DUF2505 domain-containing protein [Antrihabitans stalagmiti]
MSRTFEAKINYAAPPAVVHGVLTNTEFWHWVFKDSEHGSVETRSDAPGTISATMTNKVGGDALPGLVRKVVKGDLVLVNTDTWTTFDGQRANGTFSGRSSKGMGGIDGTFVLHADGDGTVIHAKGAAEVKVRIVGGAIERLVEQMMGNMFDGQRKYVEKWLAEQT